jgi:indolepyruvate ferredoxin oxidoreductase
MERRLVADYEREVEVLVRRLTPDTHNLAVAIARLPETIRGFGHVKLAGVEQAGKQRSELLGAIANTEQSASERKPATQPSRVAEKFLV